MQELGWGMERASLAEYVRRFERPAMDLLAGLDRAVGLALGFLLLGALLI